MSFDGNHFIPNGESTAAPSRPVKYRPASPQSFSPVFFQAFANNSHGVNSSSGSPPDVSQGVKANVHSNSPVDGGRPWVVQDFGQPQYRSKPHPVAATQPPMFAADHSGRYPRAFPTPTSRRSQGTMPSNLKHGFVNDEFAALGHQFLDQRTGTTSESSGLRTGSATSDPLSGDASNLYGDTNPYVLAPWRADHPRCRSALAKGSIRLHNDDADTLGNSALFSYETHIQSDGWACADGITPPTTTFVDHSSNERFQPDDLCHPRTGLSRCHPQYGLHHVAEIADSELVMDNPTMMDKGQWWTQPLAAQISLTNTPPPFFAQDTPCKQYRPFPLSDIDRTLSPPYSGLSLSSSNPEEPVRFLTKNFSNPIAPQDRLMPVTSIKSPSTALLSIMSRDSDTLHPSLEDTEVCPHCCFVSRAKKWSDRKSNLKRHIRDKHERAEEARPVCPEINCGKMFERSDYVLRHRRKSHGFPTNTEDISPRGE